MKVIFSFVCFFFLANVSLTSQTISFLQREFIKKQEIVQKQYNSCRKEENDVRKQLKKLNEIYNAEKNYHAFLLKEMQMIPIDINDTRLEKFNQLQIDYHYLTVYHAYVSGQLSEKENQLNLLKQVNQKLYAYQQKLFEQNEELRGFSNEGQPDITKQIKGDKNLPVYGSMKAENHSKAMSCLMSGDYAIDEVSDFFIEPTYAGVISAGTWEYPQGGMHLGVDYALPLKSDIIAPANGLILYADACVDSDNGYLGNWCGWPQGAGNSICMVCAVQDELYIVSFAHLSNEIFVSAGQQVSQGDVIALSGNSGNSTGPHTHVEVLRCRREFEEIVNFFINTADFSFGNGWKTPATCSEYACRIRPESVF